MSTNVVTVESVEKRMGKEMRISQSIKGCVIKY